jgi:hypothetical protein
VKEVDDTDGISFSPNPVVNQLTIDFKKRNVDNHLQVFDIVGRTNVFTDHYG